MTDRLQELRKLTRAATPGWRMSSSYPDDVEDCSGYLVAHCATGDGPALDRGEPLPATHASLIAAVRNALPVLLDVAEAAQLAIDEAMKIEPALSAFERVRAGLLSRHAAPTVTERSAAMPLRTALVRFTHAAAAFYAALASLEEER